MCGGSKPLYLPFRRKGITSLSPRPMHRTLRVDGCRHGRTRRNKSHIGNKSGPGRAQPGRTYVIIYRSNTSSCQRGTRRRARDRRAQIPSSKTSVLRIHCLNSMQVPVPTLSKDSVCSVHGIPEAATLLSRVFHNGGFQSTSQRYYKQSRRNGKDCKMGN